MEETVEIEDLSGGLAGDLDAQALLAKAGGKAKTWTETRPDGTKVTYEVDVEEEEEIIEVSVPTKHFPTKVLPFQSKAICVDSFCEIVGLFFSLACTVLSM